MEGQLSTFAVLNYTDFVDKTPSECLVENARVVAWNLSQVLLTIPRDFHRPLLCNAYVYKRSGNCEVDYICLRVEGGFLRAASFDPRPARAPTSLRSISRAARALSCTATDRCARGVDTGALIAGNPDNDCYPNYGVFMYPTIPANEPESNGTESNGTNLHGHGFEQQQPDPKADTRCQMAHRSTNKHRAP